MTTSPSSSPTISEISSQQFSDELSAFYKEYKRTLPWRETISPYSVVVSELMLQQTQVPRVLVKYSEWMSKFPNFETLAKASLAEVLHVWQGMGYNRRAIYLKKIAEKVISEYDGVLPTTYEELIKLPGIGKNTAGSILAFAYNSPITFIETNIRRVFIHHFFKEQHNVADSEIIPLIDQTMDRTNPREWYYALMDYGTYLAKTVANPNRKSKHYTKQSPLKGSIREARGRIIKILTQEKILDKKTLEGKTSVESERFEKAFQQLLTEEFIEEKNNRVMIKE